MHGEDLISSLHKEVSLGSTSANFIHGG